MKKIIAIFLSVMLVVTSMAIPAFASSSLTETYDSLSFGTLYPHFFTVEGTNFVPSVNSIYNFYVAAYDAHEGLLGVKHQEINMTTAGGTLKGYASFAGESYEASIVKVKYMLWDDEYRPLLESEDVNYASVDFGTAITANKIATKAAFAYGSASDTTPYMAIDGDATTSWISVANADYLRDQLVVDLGDVYPITGLNMTLADGSDANYKVYGAAASTFADKHALTNTITTASTGTIATLPSTGVRYVIFEQDAAEDAFGFKEIEIYTTETVAQALPLEAKSNTLTCVVASNAAQASNYGTPANGANIVDGNPTTAHGLTTNASLGNVILYMYDLGESKNLSHIAYQYTIKDTDNNRDNAECFQIIASDNFNPIKNSANYTVLAEVGRIDGALYTYDVTTGETTTTNYDTGLLIFDVPEAYKNTQYRYIGIYKGEATNGGTTTRLAAGTLTAYTGVVPEPEAVNVALNKPAFSYNSAADVTPALAVDGNYSTSWASLGAGSLGGLSDNFVIDLGAQFSLDSIDITPTTGASIDNITIYGANDVDNTTMDSAAAANVSDNFADETTKPYKDWDKTQLAVTGASNSGKLSLEVSGSYRYIILEQVAGATATMGFAEVAVNAFVTDANSAVTAGPVTMLNSSSTGYYFNGHASGGLAADVLQDANPSTGNNKAGNKTSAATGIRILMDLGASKTPVVTHIGYQGMATDKIDTETNAGNFKYRVRAVCEFQIIGSNSLDGPFTELGYVGMPDYTVMNANATKDTGLWIIPVNTNGQAYRFIGIRKVGSAQNATWYMQANTLQAWGTPAQ